MTFMLSNKGHIKLSDSVIEQIRSYEQHKKGDLEAGGVLLGRFVVDSKDIIIDMASEPMRGDKRTRYSFHRGAKKHQLVIDEEWKRTNGKSHYLGEWHTHPEQHPDPSGKDIDNWKNHLTRDVFSSRYLYFIIVGTREIGVWEGDRRTQKIKKLNVL